MARAITSICCSPPESVPAAWSPRSARTGKHLQHRLPGLRPRRMHRRAGCRRRACRFSATVRSGKTSRVSGTVATPLPDHASRARAVTVTSAPASRMRAGGSGQGAGDAHQGGRLARAVGAQQGHQSRPRPRSGMHHGPPARPRSRTCRPATSSMGSGLGAGAQIGFDHHRVHARTLSLSPSAMVRPEAST